MHQRINASLRNVLLARRRATVLIIVLGVLALMAVLTVIYTAIGRADQGASAAMSRQRDLDNVPRRVGDYVAQIIADDVTSTFFSPENIGTDGVLNINDLAPRRESWDYPSADPLRRSVTNDQFRRFVPTGSIDVRSTQLIINPDGQAMATPDQRIPSDPWLASTEPEDLLARILDNPQGADLPYTLRLDWPHISNVAPDGRFVNLINLRDNFDARAGIDGGQMSDRLWRFNQNEGIDFADNNIPYNFTANQFFHFRPISDPRRNTDWSDETHLPYTWADTTGDGMADARWFELVDATDRNNPRSMLTPDDRYRYFMAVRVEDLSSRVNVNTATDFRRGPRAAAPVGATPADIDLRRLLSLEDSYDLTRNWDTDPNQDFVGYSALWQPADPQSYQNYFLDGASVDDQLRLWRRIGASAYDTLRVSLLTGAIPGGEITADPRASGDALEQYAQDFFGLTPLDGQQWVFPQPDSDTFENEGFRQTHYRRVARALTGTAGFNESQYERGSLFGAADLKELLAFRGINDPRAVSKLERAIGGRHDDNGTNEELRALSPMRDNRGMEVERDFLWDNNIPDVEREEAALARAVADIRQRLTTLSGARPIRSGRVNTAGANLSSNEIRESLPNLLRRIRVDADPDAFNDLFLAYADALLPYSGLPEDDPNENLAWSIASNPELRTLHYGYRGPELALRTAAHMALNLEASVELDANGGAEPRTLPRVRTLLIDEAERPTVQNTEANPWSWWNDTEIGGQLDLNQGDAETGRLANTTGSNNDPASGAVNVYGLAPQPFLTEVSAYAIYADVPVSGGGDGEGIEWLVQAGPPPGGGTVVVPLEVTLDFSESEGNRDFMMLGVAFQVTNPFDTELNLGDPTLDGNPYYIEYNGWYFPLAGFTLERDEAGGQIRYPDSKEREAITLAPAGQEGDTKVFFALSQPLDEIQNRFERADDRDQIGPNYGELDFVGRLVERNLTINGSLSTAVKVEPINPRDFSTIPRTGIHNYFSDPQQSFNAENSTDRVVRLWRALNRDETSTADPWERDLLADRLRVPDDSSLDVRRASQPNNVIPNATAYEDTASEVEEGDVNYNSSVLTVLTWATVNRRYDDTGENLDDLDGRIMAYCIEGRWRENWNGFQRSTESLEPETLSATNFPDNEGSRTGPTFFRFRDFARRHVDPDFDGGNPDVDPRPFVATLVRHPALKGETGVGSSIGDNASNQSWSNLRTRWTWPLDYETVRPGDVLLPLAVGAVFDPYAQQEDAATELDGQWLTTSEAIALALDYDSPPATSQSWSMYERVGRSVENASAAGELRGAFDRGRLVPDDFVPFLDEDNTQEYEPGTDIPFGNALPLALNLIDRFRHLDNDFGNAQRPIPGTININTASAAVLRTLPLLAPTTGTLDGSSEWWWTGTQHDEEVDLAATIEAYRDKRFALARSSARGGSGETEYGPNYFDEVNGTDITGGRKIVTEIPALNETRGIRTAGEMLAMRQHQDTAGGDFNDRFNFDRLARSVTENPNYTGGGLLTGWRNSDDGRVDAAALRMAIANGVLGTVDVRSDYYAVWFLVHGYQRSDVEGLSADEPMLPSIQRRFLMVVDRSRVTRRGESPEIVLFKEVPATPIR